tara:strand:- start:3057 stop:3242 length:186 start_codon:yes stop_codon:yes gene_type:complete
VGLGSVIVNILSEEIINVLSLVTSINQGCNSCNSIAGAVVTVNGSVSLQSGSPISTPTSSI